MSGRPKSEIKIPEGSRRIPTLAQVKRTHVLLVVQYAPNMTSAARYLGIHRSSLTNLMKQYGYKPQMQWVPKK